MTGSNQHQDRRAEAWSRIDTTKTEDMVPSSELRGWLAEYVGLFEQLEALDAAARRILDAPKGTSHRQFRFWLMDALGDSYPASGSDDA